MPYKIKSTLFRFAWFRKFTVYCALRRLRKEAPEANVRTQQALARYCRRRRAA
jgi:hypothetical protein